MLNSKRSFYRSLNAIFYFFTVGRVASEEVVVELIKKKVFQFCIMQ